MEYQPTFTHDECENVQSIIELLDEGHRSDGAFVTIAADSATEAQQVLQTVLDKMLEA